MVTPRDIEFMQRALFLAERGRGTTTPNPVVGAVIVDADGAVVGQGAHRVAGGPHAEIFAIESAGARARGATLYCTLEPCCHVGRTGPCAERVVAAGIRRVVVALDDPNPKVAGGGFGYLRAHGVEVASGVEREAAARQNAPFVTWMTRRRPHVTMKVAMSRDGVVGRHHGAVKLTGPATDRVMHRQRAGVDALAVGAGTVLADDPQLTARSVYRHRPLIRVVFDRRGRVPSSARLFQTLSAGPVIMFVSDTGNAQADRLREAGADVLAIDAGPSGLAAAMRVLAGREVLSLLLEGGPTLQQACWDAELVDRVQVIQTPREIGDGVRAFVPPRGEGVVTEWTCGVDRVMEWDVYRAD